MNDQQIIDKALSILESRAKYNDVVLGSPAIVKDFLRLRLSGLEREEFFCIWTDAQNKLIEVDQMFVGTLSQTSVYPREVVKQALTRNAAGVILAHNHPSGTLDPSGADVLLTEHLKKALALVDVKVLDHIIVAGVSCLSMAEKGYI
jgi:DNA repair protein RadC